MSDCIEPKTRICPNCTRYFYSQYIYSNCSFCQTLLEDADILDSLLNPGGVFFQYHESEFVRQ